MYSIGDLVYVYLFDLEKTLLHMNNLREDRFGIVLDIYVQPIYNTDSVEQEIIYKIKTIKNEIIEYHSNSLTYSMIHIGNLIELIGGMNISQDKKQVLLQQISDIGTLFN